MAIIAVLELEAESNKKSDLLTFINEMVPDTRAYQGNQLTEVWVQLDGKYIVVVETWESRFAHEKYMSWRQSTGVMGKAMGFCVGAPKLRIFEKTAV